MVKTPDITRLHRIMAALRAENGCPWDRAQTHDSLKPYLIEEAYEVVEAIDAGDDSLLCEELGDLLLQIVFHARLAEEAGEFGLGEVIDAVSDKMVRRHPHIFGDAAQREGDGDSGEPISRVDTPEAVHDQWEQIKRAEGRAIFGGLPQTLPALMRARRVSEKAAGVGFDWSSADKVLDKVREELEELVEALDDSPVRAFEELGDVLFALVNLGRHLEVSAEDALRQATRRFERRFHRTEDIARRDGRQLTDCDDAELDRLWGRAKAELAAERGE
jgi:tetrapyrrole methylase family protein/MazG family protein